MISRRTPAQLVAGSDPNARLRSEEPNVTDPHDVAVASVPTLTRITSSRAIAAPRSTIWAVLSDPRQHRFFDGSGMVGDLVSSPPRGVGDVFTMSMTYRAGDHVEHYRSDNHIVAYDPGRVIEWATALPGGQPLGWTWRYDLTDIDSGVTKVTLTYDWTNTPDADVERFGVPLADAASLLRSLEQLAGGVTSDPDHPRPAWSKRAPLPRAQRSRRS